MSTNWTPEQRAKYRNPIGHLCPCGEPAVDHDGSGFVCARCRGIEETMYRHCYSKTAFVERRRPDKKSIREGERIAIGHVYTVCLPGWT